MLKELCEALLCHAANSSFKSQQSKVNVVVRTSVITSSLICSLVYRMRGYQWMLHSLYNYIHNEVKQLRYAVSGDSGFQLFCFGVHVRTYLQILIIIVLLL